METIINRIVELSGSMPDEAAFRRYLHTLSAEALHRKALDLAEDQEKPQTVPVRFWSSHVRRQATALIS